MSHAETHKDRLRVDHDAITKTVYKSDGEDGYTAGTYGYMVSTGGWFDSVGTYFEGGYDSWEHADEEARALVVRLMRERAAS